MGKSKWKQKTISRALTPSESESSGTTTDTKRLRPDNNKRQKTSQMTGHAESEVDMATLSFADALSAGLAFEQLHSYDGAVEAFQRAVECQPNHLEALTHLADNYVSAGDPDKALPLYIKASKLKGGQEDASIWFRLGLTYVAVDQLPQATNAYQTSMRINAIALEKVNGADENSKELRKAYSITLAVLAEAYGERRDLDSAVKVFEDAVVKLPDSANMQYNLANMRMARSKSMADEAFDAEVVQRLERAIELDSGSRDFVVDLIEYLEQHKQRPDRLCELKRKAAELESATTTATSDIAEGKDEGSATSEEEEDSEDEE
ncbi:unnamed protein product [Hyaloperonospora brassicae]|uniref:Uncharacterized protein n=1 Tax=Hyaloperonospora brassicae TaxID=162125 RepID=A0AAV0TZC2_HYABA|nr:unnamed protein product [Hyaloperonospora brassicae]